MALNILIIGGVALGTKAATRARRIMPDANITLIDQGTYISYGGCGIPYFVGGEVSSVRGLRTTGANVIRDEAFFDDLKGVTAICHTRALSIDRKAKTVLVENVKTGEQSSMPYDKLVIATGSSPRIPPIPGTDLKNVTSVTCLEAAKAIQEQCAARQIGHAVIIGAGFIGLEMADNLHHAGLSVSIVEATDQVMAPVDPEMAEILHNNIRSNGVGLYLADGVASFEDKGTSVDVKLSSGTVLSADIVILSIGVRPNSQIAKEAGLELNARGGIIVNDHMQTADPDIYAAGDVVEVEDFIFGDRTMVPLAGPANKQARIVADNICGIPSTYKGTQGSSVAKVFDMAAASTGANEKALIRRGLVRGKDYTSILINQNSHAGYYPGAVPIYLKLLFSVDGGKIYGAQIIGQDGVDKRIDTIGTAIRLGAGVSALKDLELAYAPPFNSAKDPVNMAGFTAENVLRGLVKFSDWKIPEDAVILDIREEPEVAEYAFPGAVCIPLGQLRSRLDELDRGTHYVVMCAGGVRAYNAARILTQNEFGNVEVYPAGSKFYRLLHPEQ
jgi:NADPH-dependent 2,4-dienoyl-CoA reductase/sulfur reductase-like enzyme/rhodanese-related sulfurtransferase